MKTLLSVLLPATAGNTIHGMKLPVYVFTVLAVISSPGAHSRVARQTKRR
jgi:hypothetical protein